MNLLNMGIRNSIRKVASISYVSANGYNPAQVLQNSLSILQYNGDAYLCTNVKASNYTAYGTLNLRTLLKGPSNNYGSSSFDCYASFTVGSEALYMLDSSAIGDDNKYVYRVAINPSNGVLYQTLVATLPLRTYPGVSPCRVDLGNGNSLLIGGYDASASYALSKFCYFLSLPTYETPQIIKTADFPIACCMGNACMLPDGRILAHAGFNSSGVSTSCYIGTISGSYISWVATNNLPISAARGGFISMGDGKIILLGGYNDSLVYDTSIYVGTVSGNTVTWKISSKTLPSEFPNNLNYLNTSAPSILYNGKIYIVLPIRNSWDAIVYVIDNAALL